MVNFQTSPHSVGDNGILLSMLSQDAGVPVDSSGNLSNGSDLDGAFANGAEHLERIAQSADARHCFAEHYLSFALSRALLPEDECSLSRVASGFASSGDLKRLIVAVAQR